MSMTKAEIRSLSRQFLDERTAETWLDTELDGLFNIVHSLRRAQIISLHRKDFVTHVDFTYPANTDFVLWSQIQELAGVDSFDVHEWFQVEDRTDPDNRVEVQPVDWMRRHEVWAPTGARTNLARRDASYFWAYKGREFWIIRRPTNTLPLRVYYVPASVSFGVTPRDDLRRPEFSMFNELLSIDIAVLARESVGDDLKNLGGVQDRLERALIKAYSERNASEADFMIADPADFTHGIGAR